ncbi:hypothetical protein PM082_008365 [Marasmius tenuissimus]|nr:hypothetical protein PM082_008365 [Marasmius tenuissimus]
MRSANRSTHELHALFNNILRISVIDGRIFLGSFLGTDQALNLLLLDAEEFCVVDATLPNLDGRFDGGMLIENPGGRYVGQIVIPWKEIVKVEAHGGLKAQEERHRLYL